MALRMSSAHSSLMQLSDPSRLSLVIPLPPPCASFFLSLSSLCVRLSVRLSAGAGSTREACLKASVRVSQSVSQSLRNFLANGSYDKFVCDCECDGLVHSNLNMNF